MADKKPVECIAGFDKEGKPTPFKIRFEDAEGKHVIKIDKVVSRDEKRGFGTNNGHPVRLFVFNCQSIIEGLAVPFTLHFENKFSTWTLITQDNQKSDNQGKTVFFDTIPLEVLLAEID